MKAQLDEIERVSTLLWAHVTESDLLLQTLAQLSPRMLKAELEEDRTQSLIMSPNTASYLSLSPGGVYNSSLLPSTPRLSNHNESP